MSNSIACLVICLICMSVILISGCLDSNTEKQVNPLPTLVIPQTNSEKAVVDANNKFAFNIYSTLINDAQFENQTMFFSPHSISSALAITYEGARGQTADEIQSVSFLPNDTNLRRQGFRQLYQDINKQNSKYTLKTANALWAEKTYPFRPDYINTVFEYYNANASNLDFKNQPEGCRISINTWIEDQTDKKITNLIPSGAISPLTRLVITNAVYFKGKWIEPFTKNQTKNDIFYVTPENKVTVQMMQRTDETAIFWYTETDTMQVLEMPYANDSKKQLSMLVLLPKNKDLISVEKSLKIEQIAELKNALVNQRVNVSFPKFKIESQYTLSRTLRSMGMTSAFTDQADFSGMDGTRNLLIGNIIHKAFIDVNEEGTEAAAATADLMGVTNIRNGFSVPEFRADHPFMFIIQDSETGNILFMGRMNNPNG